MKTIKESVDIKASKDKVWNVLFDGEANKIWFSEFSNGAHSEGDWKVGSRIIFIDDSKSGLAAKVNVNKPNEEMSVEYEGSTYDGVLDENHEETKMWKGLKESYYLSEKDGVTTLSAVSEVPDEFGEIMQPAWVKAFQKIKEVCEQMQDLENEGFKDLRVCPLPPQKTPEHTHDNHTVHIILKGNLTTIDSSGTNTYKQGERVDFPAGTTHTAECDIKDGMMIVGEKV